MVVVAILGLLLPGYLLACALRVPMAWAVAFPLSVMLLAETVIAYTLLGVPICFGYVVGPLVIASLICLAVWRRRKSESHEAAAPPLLQGVSKDLLLVIGIEVGLVLLGMIVRTSMQPLAGFDTPFRWDGLARLMLDYHNLSYYPPVTAEDYSKYTYPDGIPPLTSVVYWWLYAAWGSACPTLTSLVVLLQTVSCLAIAFYATCGLLGPVAGLVTVGVLASSSLFLTGIAIGQETGYTALCYAGQLLFAFAAVRRPTVPSVVLAGIFAGLGGLAREYGPLLSVCGFAVLACQRETRRYLPLFCLVAAACFAPWYLRTWVRTGTPFYPMNISLTSQSNPVLGGMLAMYRDLFGMQTFSTWEWIRIALMLLAGAPLALLAGVAGIAAIGRRGIAITVSVFVAFFLCIWSIPYTAGGVDYAVRMLTPAWVVLSVAAGAVSGLLVPSTDTRKIVLRAAVVLVFVLSGGYAVLTCWSHPLGPKYLRQVIALVLPDPLDMSKHAVALAKKMETLPLKPTGILTDDSFFAVALQRNTRFRPVMIWSPEVAFVFDRQLTPDEVQRRLTEEGIGLVSVDYQSYNNGYLSECPFYRRFFNQDEIDWKQLLLAIPKEKLVFTLSSQLQPTAVQSPQP